MDASQRSHWGVWAYARRTADLGRARRGVRYVSTPISETVKEVAATQLFGGVLAAVGADIQTARENESLVSIGRKFGLQHPAPLLELNSPIYPEIETCYQKLRNTHTLKVVLLCVVSSSMCISVPPV